MKHSMSPNVLLADEEYEEEYNLPKVNPQASIKENEYFTPEQLREWIEQGIKSICKIYLEEDTFGWVQLLDHIIGHCGCSIDRAMEKYYPDNYFSAHYLYKFRRRQLICEIERAYRHYIIDNVDMFFIIEDKAMVKVQRKFFEQ